MTTEDSTARQCEASEDWPKKVPATPKRVRSVDNAATVQLRTVHLGLLTDNLSHWSCPDARVPHASKIPLIELLTCGDFSLLAVPALAAVSEGQEDRVALLDRLDTRPDADHDAGPFVTDCTGVRRRKDAGGDQEVGVAAASDKKGERDETWVGQAAKLASGRTGHMQ